ncbi:COP9 signalosome complex subunit 6 [Tritrichomonas musculus]|uniref:COP9 signalosome complex subunit 6 n=2 Tax=Tritrichomonas musculus TaxID=1915356 RepID=A0ABR2L3A5_9EUKA
MTNISILMHPQAMLVMSNHYTRRQYDDANVKLPVHVGLLLGLTDGAHIEVNSALEILITGKPGDLVIDQKFIDNAYKDLHKATFPKDTPIGWYTCDKIDKNVHQELSAKIDELITSLDSETLLYGEFIIDEKNEKIDAQNKSPLTLFLFNDSNLIPVDFTYETEPAERIAMMQLQSEGSVEDQTQFTAKAFQSLDKDLEKVQKYLEKVAKKEIPFDAERVRKAATIAQWWDHNCGEEQPSDRIEEQANLALLCGMILETLTLYEKHA